MSVYFFEEICRIQKCSWRCSHIRTKFTTFLSSNPDTDQYRYLMQACEVELDQK